MLSTTIERGRGEQNRFFFFFLLLFSSSSSSTPISVFFLESSRSSVSPSPVHTIPFVVSVCRRRRPSVSREPVFAMIDGRAPKNSQPVVAPFPSPLPQPRGSSRGRGGGGVASARSEMASMVHWFMPPACKSHRRGRFPSSLFHGGQSRDAFLGREKWPWNVIQEPPSSGSPLSPSLIFQWRRNGAQLFETDKLADQRLYNLWVFPPWTKGNGWGGRERESEGGRKVSSSAFRANIGRNSAGDPNCPRFAYTPVSSRKRKKERERESFFLNCQEQFLRRDGCSSSRSLSRRDLFSLKDDPFVTWPIEYLPRTASLRFVLLGWDVGDVLRTAMYFDSSFI